MPVANHKLHISHRLLHLTSVADISELLGRTLVIVAHADDEAVACGALLQRMSDPAVVICTDGAPRDAYFWQAYGSRAEYGRVRVREARRALQAVGVRDVHLLPEFEAEGAFADQELFRRIPLAMRHLRKIAQQTGSEAVLTPAYEGGHPDHDTCNFLGCQLAGELQVPAWEACLYHRYAGEKMTIQHFVQTTGEEVRLDISAEELARKRTMQAAYVSQRDVLAMFHPDLEMVRPMVHYDYLQPPHEGTLNYEAWGWPIRGWELCDRFQQFLNSERSGFGTAAERRIA